MSLDNEDHKVLCALVDELIKMRVELSRIRHILESPIDVKVIK